MHMNSKSNPLHLLCECWNLMSHTAMQRKRYANGQKGHICLHRQTHIHTHARTQTHTHTQTDRQTDEQRTSLCFGRTPKVNWTCGNDKVKLYSFCIKFWCWHFSALIAVHLSLSLFLCNSITLLHPLHHYMPKATTINMIGPSHKRRRAIIWTGITREIDFKCIGLCGNEFVALGVCFFYVCVCLCMCVHECVL